MDNYLQAIGWWNFVGSVLMLGCLHQPFGKKMFNEWTMIFTTEFQLDYWGKLWFVWATGINIFFGLVNIKVVEWGTMEFKEFIIWFDIIAYVLFVFMAAWGQKVKRCGSGVYSAYFIFLFWIVWGILSLFDIV